MREIDGEEQRIREYKKWIDKKVLEKLGPEGLKLIAKYTEPSE